MLLLLALVGCGSRGVDCSQDTTVLAKSGDRELTCAEAATAQRYVVVLAGRPVDPIVRDNLRKALVKDFANDAAATEAAVIRAGQLADELMALDGPSAAQRRSTHLYDALYADHPVLPGAAHAVFEGHVAVWASHAADRLVLAEMDIEGWVFYSSLCREVQGGDPLRLSVGDRYSVYNDVKERFETGSRGEREALVSIGPFWWSVQDQWAAASYERQQAWIRAAPLPPPQNATSLAYMGSILEGDLPRHASTLHARLAPLGLRD